MFDKTLFKKKTDSLRVTEGIRDTYLSESFSDSDSELETQ